MGGLIRVKVKQGDWYEVESGNPEMYSNGIVIYFMHVLIPLNIETIKTELKMIAEKY